MRPTTFSWQVSRFALSSCDLKFLTVPHGRRGSEVLRRSDRNGRIRLEICWDPISNFANAQPNTKVEQKKKEEETLTKCRPSLVPLDPIPATFPSLLPPSNEYIELKYGFCIIDKMKPSDFCWCSKFLERCFLSLRWRRCYHHVSLMCYLKSMAFSSSSSTCYVVA